MPSRHEFDVLVYCRKRNAGHDLRHFEAAVGRHEGVRPFALGVAMKNFRRSEALMQHNVALERGQGLVLKKFPGARLQLIISPL